nr:hypothetical protein StreXyl84_62710 [Streptomyces sp. Xyl84]
MLSTRGDILADWLVAGQALERGPLEAASAGLATSPTSHPLQSADLPLLARDPAAGHGRVQMEGQMVLRLGHGPPGAVPPRRPAEDVLEVLAGAEGTPGR